MTGKGKVHNGLHTGAVVEDHRIVAVLACGQACEAEHAEHEGGGLHVVVYQNVVETRDEGGWRGKVARSKGRGF